MTLPANGTMSANIINVELSKPFNALFSIDATDSRALANVIPPQSEIMYSDFYGKSAAAANVTRISWSPGSITAGQSSILDFDFDRSTTWMYSVPGGNPSSGSGGPATSGSVTVNFPNAGGYTGTVTPTGGPSSSASLSVAAAGRTLTMRIVGGGGAGGQGHLRGGGGGGGAGARYDPTEIFRYNSQYTISVGGGGSGAFGGNRRGGSSGVSGVGISISVGGGGGGGTWGGQSAESSGTPNVTVTGGGGGGAFGGNPSASPGGTQSGPFQGGNTNGGGAAGLDFPPASRATTGSGGGGGGGQGTGAQNGGSTVGLTTQWYRGVPGTPPGTPGPQVNVDTLTHGADGGSGEPFFSVWGLRTSGAIFPNADINSTGTAVSGNDGWGGNISYPGPYFFGCGGGGGGNDGTAATCGPGGGGGFWDPFDSYQPNGRAWQPAAQGVAIDLNARDGFGFGGRGGFGGGGNSSAATSDGGNGGSGFVAIVDDTGPRYIEATRTFSGSSKIQWQPGSLPTYTVVSSLGYPIYVCAVPTIGAGPYYRFTLLP